MSARSKTPTRKGSAPGPTLDDGPTEIDAGSFGHDEGVPKKPVVPVVQPIKAISRDGLWRGFDVNVIDGIVNGTAAAVGASSAALRRLQTGSVRAYAGSLFVGVVVILGYYLWR